MVTVVSKDFKLTKYFYVEFSFYKSVYVFPKNASKTGHSQKSPNDPDKKVSNFAFLKIAKSWTRSKSPNDPDIFSNKNWTLVFSKTGHFRTF